MAWTRRVRADRQAKSWPLVLPAIDDNGFLFTQEGHRQAGGAGPPSKDRTFFI
jgi:hypothetical protein